MKYFLSIAALLIILASCKKTEPTVTREDELRMGKWKMVAGTIQVDPYVGKDTLIHYYDSLPGCKRDDYIVFKTNYVATQNSGEKCDPSEPDEIEFRWELFNNGTGINFWNANETFFGKPTISAPIINYNSSRFTIKYTEYWTSPVDNTKKDTLVFTHTFAKF